MEIGGYQITWDQIAWVIIDAGVLYLLLDGLCNYKPPVLCGEPCPRCGRGCEYHAGHESHDHGHFVPGRRMYPIWHWWLRGDKDIRNNQK